jgi:hypothetical protein
LDLREDDYGLAIIFTFYKTRLLEIEKNRNEKIENNKQINLNRFYEENKLDVSNLFSFENKDEEE